MSMLHLLSYSFIQRGYIAGSFIAALCAMLGMFLVLRKLSLIGDGLSHVSFGAIAIGLFFGLAPIGVAIPLVILASIGILKISEKARIYGDAAIGIISAIGISVGVVLASASNGFNVDLFSYLFGNILAISNRDVMTSILLALVVIIVIAFFYQDMIATAFDERFARAIGIKTGTINLVLTCLTAVTVVLAVNVVGIMLVSALLILPAVTALQIAKGFRAAMIAAVAIAVFSVLSGITIAFYANIPAGASIVLVNAALFGLTLMKRVFVKN